MRRKHFKSLLFFIKNKDDDITLGLTNYRNVSNDTNCDGDEIRTGRKSIFKKPSMSLH